VSVAVTLPDGRIVQLRRIVPRRVLKSTKQDPVEFIARGMTDDVTECMNGVDYKEIEVKVNDTARTIDGLHVLKHTLVEMLAHAASGFGRGNHTSNHFTDDSRGKLMMG